jgi:putative SOS response-associated peptidase YedK
MCGRYSFYAYQMTPDEFEERFGIPMPAELQFQPSYNIGPYQQVPVLCNNGENGRQIKLMFWQLIPSFSREFKSKYSMINTRMETFDKKGFWPELLQCCRCIVPANSFFEWARVEVKSVHPKTGRVRKKIRKIPFKFELQEGGFMALGAIYSIWRDAENKPYYSFSIITTPANELVGKVHPRMPLILAHDSEKVWLDPAVRNFTQVRSLLKPFPAGKMRYTVVSEAVNNIRNDGPELLEPVEQAVQATLF